MATTTINPVHQVLSKGVLKVTWSGVGVISTSTTIVYGPASLGGYERINAIADGTFLSGGLTLRGAHTATGTYATLKTVTGGTMGFTVAAVKRAQESMPFLRPTVSTATANTNRSISLTVIAYSDRK